MCRCSRKLKGRDRVSRKVPSNRAEDIFLVDQPRGYTSAAVSKGSSLLLRVLRTFRTLAHGFLLLLPRFGAAEAFYAGCVIAALEHLHERKIIYRDLKPECSG